MSENTKRHNFKVALLVKTADGIKKFVQYVHVEGLKTKISATYEVGSPFRVDFVCEVYPEPEVTAWFGRMLKTDFGRPSEDFITKDPDAEFKALFPEGIKVIGPAREIRWSLPAGDEQFTNLYRQVSAELDAVDISNL